MYVMQINAEATGRKFEVWNVSTGRLVVAFRLRTDAEREVAYQSAQERERAMRLPLNPYIEPDDPRNAAAVAHNDALARAGGPRVDVELAACLDWFIERLPSAA